MERILYPKVKQGYVNKVRHTGVYVGARNHDGTAVTTATMACGRSDTANCPCNTINACRTKATAASCFTSCRLVFPINPGRCHWFRSGSRGHKRHSSSRGTRGAADVFLAAG